MPQNPIDRYWNAIHKAGYSLGSTAVITPEGHRWVVDAYQEGGKMFVETAVHEGDALERLYNTVMAAGVVDPR